MNQTKSNGNVNLKYNYSQSARVTSNYEYYGHCAAALDYQAKQLLEKIHNMLDRLKFNMQKGVLQAIEVTMLNRRLACFGLYSTITYTNSPMTYRFNQQVTMIEMRH